MRWLACMIASVVGAGPALAQATSADSLAQPRHDLIQAYAAKDYPTLCKLLAPDASFRGSVKPTEWTIGRDAIITQRWGAKATCANQPVNPIQAFSVPTHTLALEPDAGAGMAHDVATVNPRGTEQIAIDFGVMGMFVRPEITDRSVPEYHHRYLMIWRNAGSGWQLTHVDMYAP